MRVLIFLVSYILINSQLFGQQNHFIYLETEEDISFNVKIGEQLMSSSGRGYLIIPKLIDSTYELNIGFPGKGWPVQKISLKVAGSDAGYILKNFDSDRWGLKNMQSAEIIISKAGNAKRDTGMVNHSDGFADVLAEVVSTPSIKQNTMVNESPGNMDTIKARPADRQEPNNSELRSKGAIPMPGYPVTSQKIFTMLESSGRSAIYVDKFDNRLDTVRIFIPYSGFEQNAGDSSSLSKAFTNNNLQKADSIRMQEATAGKQEFIPEEKKMPVVPLPDSIPVPGSDPLEPAKTMNKKQEMVKKEGLSSREQINTVCKTVASENDFLNLRKKMAAQRSDENMLLMAKKSFINRCFTSEQVSNLSALFLKDDGKYNFFDAAYPHISDPQNFNDLIRFLSDEYYKNRFRAMIRH